MPHIRVERSLVISSESQKVNGEAVNPKEYFHSSHETDFYSSVKTHTPLIDMEKCEKLFAQDYFNIRKVYEDSQKYINVHAQVGKLTKNHKFIYQ